MRAYHESEWAVRRWDWFNGGRIVEPLSFCQFWRTVLFYVPVRWLLTPLLIMSRAAAGVPMPRIVDQGMLSAGNGLWLLLRIIGQVLWFCAHPLRWVMPPVGRIALTGAVSAGEPVAAFGKRHKEGLETVGKVLIVLVLIVCYGVILVALLLESWFWTLVGISSLMTTLFAGYGVIKSGILGLFWQAAVAAHHGICPPMDIVR